ncbi:MAG: PilZ domain-containing protein [Terriglobales bacterium]
MTNPVLNRMERRAAQRFELHMPVAVSFEGGVVSGFTQDLSARGIFFYTETELPVGTVVELTFTMPSEITLGESMPVRCRGHVLRAARAQGGRRSGIAARLDSYEYLPADTAEPVSQFMRISAAGAEASRPLTR